MIHGSSNSVQAYIGCEAVDKEAVANAFCKAAANYDNYAEFQRNVGQQLLNKLPKDLSGKVVLDLGSGTGYFAQKLLARGATVVCVDISAGMLAAAKKRCGEADVTYLLADAERLPLETGSVDYVFSSLALQWCADLAEPIREMKRITKANGKVFFSTLLDGSLIELKKAWAKIDSYQHVNDFISNNQVKLR